MSSRLANQFDPTYQDYLNGDGDATVTIPDGARAVSFSVQASTLTDATVDVTPAGRSAWPTFTIKAGGTLTETIEDVDCLIGAEFVFVGVDTYSIKLAKAAP